MVTFADLMALILTFFVLLLSFSTIDAKKYEEIVRSFGAIFGTGTGIIPNGGMAIVPPLSVTCPEMPPTLGAAARPKEDEPLAEIVPEESDDLEEAPVPPDATSQTGETVAARMARLFERLQRQFKTEIAAGLVELEERDDSVRVRFREAISFPSGDATISATFDDVLYIMGAILRETRGTIIVSGHTDDRPIATDRFRSNWELSAARAVSVVHYLIHNAGIQKTRLVAEGYADSLPIVPNDTDEHRARNRRVEITIRPPTKDQLVCEGG